jgi:hypothetical protein
MSRARTYTKSEITDAAAAAAMHNVRVVMHPSGEIEFAPKSFAAAKEVEDEGEKAWEAWRRGRQASGRA